MSEESPAKHAERLLQLSEEATRIASSLTQLSMVFASALRQNPATNSKDPDLSAETISCICQIAKIGDSKPVDLTFTPFQDV